MVYPFSIALAQQDDESVIQARQLAPVKRMRSLVFGGGRRLFDNIDRTSVAVELVEAVNSPMTTHLHYRVVKPR